MSISNINRNKRIQDKAYELIVIGYKQHIDNGGDIRDLDFSQFNERADEFYDFILRYTKIRNQKLNPKKGLFDD